MRQAIKRALTENAALKTVAVILSVTLFILVRGDKETERFLTVAVAYEKPMGANLVGSLPGTLEVKVSGPWTRIKRLDPAAVDPVRVDLSEAKEGDFVFEDSLIKLPPGIRVAAVKPSRIAIEYEVRAEVPIRAVVEGDPAEGFAKLQEHPCEPASAMIRGPRTAVAALHELRTEAISVDGLRESFARKVQLAPLPPGVSFAAAPIEAVNVRVRLVEEAHSRTLAAVPLLIRPSPGVNAGDRLARASVEPQKVEVVLRGMAARVAAADPARISAVVELHAEDLVLSRSRPALVAIEGLPDGVAVEVHPPRVILWPDKPR